MSPLEQLALSMPRTLLSEVLVNGVAFNSLEQNISGSVLLSTQGASGLGSEPVENVTDINQRKNPDVRKRLSAPALRTFFKIADKWELSVSEQCGLLGWIASSTYHKYKAGKIGTLTYDGLTRISLIIGIYKALHILYPDNGLADRWVKMPNKNPMFAGKPALSMMIDAGIDGLYKVRRLVDSRRGGWN
ncbi:MAG: MbcA/ParS/Xre antitoxin family protein [Leptospirillia bacterium]